jgi:hypothetical protein
MESGRHICPPVHTVIISVMTLCSQVGGSLTLILNSLVITSYKVASRWPCFGGNTACVFRILKTEKWFQFQRRFEHYCYSHFLHQKSEWELKVIKMLMKLIFTVNNNSTTAPNNVTKSLSLLFLFLSENWLYLHDWRYYRPWSMEHKYSKKLWCNNKSSTTTEWRISNYTRVSNSGKPRAKSIKCVSTFPINGLRF